MGGFIATIKDNTERWNDLLQMFKYLAGGVSTAANQGAAREKDGVTTLGQGVPAVDFGVSGTLILAQAPMFRQIGQPPGKSFAAHFKKHVRRVKAIRAHLGAESTEVTFKGSGQQFRVVRIIVRRLLQWITIACEEMTLSNTDATLATMMLMFVKLPAQVLIDCFTIGSNCLGGRHSRCSLVVRD